MKKEISYDRKYFFIFKIIYKNVFLYLSSNKLLYILFIYKKTFGIAWARVSRSNKVTSFTATE